jgi:hypothetical protein
VGQNIVCGPEVLLADNRRALEETDEEETKENVVTLKAPQGANRRGLMPFWTPDSCYAACLPQLAPDTSFVINIYYDSSGVQTCTCCRVCEGVRYVPG